MDDMAEFLLARIEEEEVAALQLSVLRDRVHAGDPHLADDVRKGIAALFSTGRIDPVRILADCAARRRIVVEHQEHADLLRGAAEAFDAGVYAGLGYALGYLALPYADHPDYRPEWQP